MLRNVTALLGTPILAKDGEIGHLNDVLVDDQSWVIRYFVVETGKLLSRRRVLLSPFSVSEPKWEKPVLPVNLMSEEVQQSPDADTDLPVYRQQEIAMTQQYGWPAYGPITAAHLRENGGESTGDPNLRSVKELLTYRVRTLDGEMGSLDDLIVEDVNWFIRFLLLNVGSWLKDQKLLVATRWVGSVSWANREVFLPHSHDTL
jgi:uncharacterized protein YrrD